MSALSTVTLNNTGTLRLSATPNYSTVSNFGGNGSSFPGGTFNVSGSISANGWTVNTDYGSTTPTTPFPTTDALQLTDNNGGEARSAFYNTPVAYQSGASGFTASFTYTPSGSLAADGVAFILQNDSRGPTALGPRAETSPTAARRDHAERRRGDQYLRRHQWRRRH